MITLRAVCVRRRQNVTLG